MTKYINCNYTAIAIIITVSVSSIGYSPSGINVFRYSHVAVSIILACTSLDV